MRDSQRSKVYAAERPLMRAPERTKFETQADAQAFVDKVMKSAWTKKQGFRNLDRPVEVVFSLRIKQYGAMYTRGGKITVRPGRASDLLLLHEMAHHFTESRTIAWHGYEFCDAYLRLVRHFLGVETYNLLLAAFKEHKVRYKAKRYVSPEQREALVNRLKGAA